MKSFPVAGAVRCAVQLGLAATLVAGLVLALSGAPAAAEPAREAALREASRPGAFCTPSGCRPRSATGWTAAAFGVVAVAMGWRARRREDAGAGH